MNNFMERARQRMCSDNADSNTVSHILWIVLVVVLVLAIGAMIYNSVMTKGAETRDLINNSNATFSTTPTTP